MKVTRTWILVADGARARVFLNEGPGRGLEPAFAGEFVASHAPTRELGSDRPGRQAGTRTAGRHGIEPHVDWHTFEKHRFASSMARIVNDAANRKAFDRLVLIAPPEPLGALRAKLSAGARDRVTMEIGKDLTNVPPHDLPARLREFLIL